MSPPPEDMSAKAAKVLGVGAGVGLGLGISRSASRRSKKGEDSATPNTKAFSNPFAVDDDDDIVMVGAADATPNPDKSERRRSRVGQAHAAQSIQTRARRN